MRQPNKSRQTEEKARTKPDSSDQMRRLRTDWCNTTWSCQWLWQHASGRKWGVNGYRPKCSRAKNGCGTQVCVRARACTQPHTAHTHNPLAMSTPTTGQVPPDEVHLQSAAKQMGCNRARQGRTPTEPSCMAMLDLIFVENPGPDGS